MNEPEITIREELVLESTFVDRIREAFKKSNNAGKDLNFDELGFDIICNDNNNLVCQGHNPRWILIIDILNNKWSLHFKEHEGKINSNKEGD